VAKVEREERKGGERRGCRKITLGSAEDRAERTKGAKKTW